MNHTRATTARAVITTVEKATTKLLKTTVRIATTTHLPKTTKHAVRTTTLADLLRTTTISLLDTTAAAYDYSDEAILGTGGGSGSGGEDNVPAAVTDMYGETIPVGDYGDYGAGDAGSGSGSGEPIDEQEPQRIFFGVFFVLSFAAILLNFYISIFGRRMRLAGIRWHTIQINLFNMLQLFLMVNATDLSPWKGFLHNDAFTNDKIAIEQMTLSTFYASMTFIIPTTVITYFFPNLSRTHLLQWAMWLPLYLALTIGAVLIFFSNWWTLDPETQRQTTWTSPLQGYQIFVLLAFHFLLVLLFLSVIVAIVLFIVHASVHAGSPKSAVSRRFYRLTELCLFLVYALVIDGFHALESGYTMMGFALEKILPILLAPPASDGGDGGTPAPGDGGGGGGGLGGLPSIPTFAFTLIAWMEPSLMLIPCIEWLCTVVCIKMYREQYIHLISCGAIYGDPKHGAFEVVSKRIVQRGKGHSGMQKDARWATPSPARVQPEPYPAPVEVQQPPSYTTTTQ